MLIKGAPFVSGRYTKGSEHLLYQKWYISKGVWASGRSLPVVLSFVEYPEKLNTSRQAQASTSDCGVGNLVPRKFPFALR